MIAALISFAAALSAPATTDEVIYLGPADLGGPCYIKVADKPTESPPPECTHAISAANTAKDKAVLYFAWAYSLNESGASLEALPSLDRALMFAPNFSNARHERSYTLSELGYYERALIDSNIDVQLTPQAAPAYQERAFARHRLADFEGSLADRLKIIELGSSGHDSEIAVIEALMWLGRYDEASKRLAGLPPSDDDKKLRADIDRRRQFKPDGNETKRCTMDQDVSDRETARRLVDDCTWAFDHEANRAKRADYLTMRAVVSVIEFQDSEANVPDLQIAAALDPSNPQRHINYGNALLNASHSWAARNEFELALAHPNLTKRDKALALAGRGRARGNLGDLAGAKSDVKASFEIEPGMANIWLAGDLAFADGNKEAAKKFWMMLYRMGIRDDSLIDNLKSVGIEHPEQEPE